MLAEFSPKHLPQRPWGERLMYDPLSPVDVTIHEINQMNSVLTLSVRNTTVYDELSTEYDAMLPQERAALLDNMSLNPSSRNKIEKYLTRTMDFNLPFMYSVLDAIPLDYLYMSRYDRKAFKEGVITHEEYLSLTINRAYQTLGDMSDLLKAFKFIEEKRVSETLSDRGEVVKAQIDLVLLQHFQMTLGENPLPQLSLMEEQERLKLLFVETARKDGLPPEFLE